MSSSDSKNKKEDKKSFSKNAMGIFSDISKSGVRPSHELRQMQETLHEIEQLVNSGENVGLLAKRDTPTDLLHTSSAKTTDQERDSIQLTSQNFLQPDQLTFTKVNPEPIPPTPSQTRHMLHLAQPPHKVSDFALEPATKPAPEVQISNLEPAPPSSSKQTNPDPT